ncbi:MAG: hypothetical protein IPM82_22595 [Saprospiraceae bacterium]|nr:hypothetical protein [Saprospiraceae bacterium]
MKKQTGIWLDSKEANFIELQDGDLIRIHKIDSDMGSSHFKGGSPGQGGSEKTHANRRQNEEHSYFKEIIENVKGADEVVIFGPGEAKDLLVNAIKEHPSHFDSTLRAVLTADSMTENQKVAYVKSFFEAS